MISKVLVFLTVLISTGALDLYEGDRCLDNNSNEGRCVELEDCKSAFGDLKRGIRPVMCSGSAKSLLVCCTDDLESRGSADLKRISVRKCEEYTKPVVSITKFFFLEVDPVPNTIKSSNCEYDRVELIVGGEDAALGEFPHMAAIGWDNGTAYDFKCGGTLISSYFVMTAAHCLLDTTSLPPVIVRLGELNIDPYVDDKANPVDVGIQSLFSHPEYRSPKKYYDLALIKLERDVRFDKFIRPACLWTEDEFDGNQKAIATGWGVTDPNNRKKSAMLQKVAISLLSNELCNNSLASLKNRHWTDGFLDTQICAGEIGAGKDTCEGDSGGPLQITARNNSCIFYVIGVTSFGSKQCGPRPAVYTRVSKFVDWIESVVWPGET